MSPLREDRHPDGTILLRSRLLETHGFQHAFATAVGPGGRVLDLARPGESRLGSSNHVLEENLAVFRRLVASEATLATSRQVHGVDVVPAAQVADRTGDLIVADDPTHLAAIRTADCVPILVGCRRRGVVVAIHAGWRGLVADAPGTGVRHLLDRGSEPDTIVAAIGPAIGVDRFEIGEEVVEAFRASGLDDALSDRGPRMHADLHAAARLRLARVGVAPDAIDGESICTASDDRFFSHRRDGGRTGRHLSGIRCWRSASPSGTI